MNSTLARFVSGDCLHRASSASHSTIMSMLTEFQQAGAKMEAAASSNESLLPSLHVRKSFGTDRLTDACDLSLRTIILSRDNAISRLKSWQRLFEKHLCERAEEADANAELLEACSRLCHRVGIHALDALQTSKLVVDLADDLCSSFSFVRHALADTELVLPSIQRASRVWHEAVDGAATALWGSGLTCYTLTSSHAAVASFKLRPISVGPAAAPAEFVCPDDIALQILDAKGTLLEVAVSITIEADGVFVVQYAVNVDGDHELRLLVFVCGVLCGGTHSITSTYLGTTGTTFVTSHEIAPGDARGLAISPDNSKVAVSYFQEKAVRVYDALDYKCLYTHTVTGSPWKLSFIDDATLLVSHVKAPDGDECVIACRLPDFKCMRTYNFEGAICVAHRDKLVAIGGKPVAVGLFDLDSASLIHKFGDIGTSSSGPGYIGAFPCGIDITLDSKFVLVAEESANRVSVFNVSTGAFVRFIGDRLLNNYGKDLICCKDAIVVVDCCNHRIAVFSNEGPGETLLNTWGTHGKLPGQFHYPIALGVAGRNLLVLSAGRVHVFQ